MSVQFNYSVKFYNPVTSRQGKGVQVMKFTDKAEAEKFAATRFLYARPAVVKEIEPVDKAVDSRLREER